MKKLIGFLLVAAMLLSFTGCTLPEGINLNIDLFPPRSITFSEGLKFTSNGDGTCTLSGIGIAEDTDLVIPPTSPKGNTVTAIAPYAFANASTLTSVYLPESLRAIGKGAFADCYSLTDFYYNGTAEQWAEVSLGEDNSEIEENLRFFSEQKPETSGSFWHLENGKPTLWSSHLQFYSNGDGTCIFVGAEGQLKGAFTIPDTSPAGDRVTSIGYAALRDQTELTHVNIPSSVQTIEYTAFQNCSSLSSIRIPMSVTEIRDYAFYYCFALRDVYYGGGKIRWDNIKMGKYNDVFTDPATNLYFAN